MKAIAAEYAVPDAAVLAIEAGCDGVLICSGDHDTQAAALEALVHAVEERAPAAGARRGRAASASSARRSGFSRRPVARAAARGARAAVGARPRRASRDRRRDGPLSVMLKPRALSPAIASPSSRPPARSIATSSTAASRRSAGWDSSRSTTTSVFARQRYVAGSARGSRGRHSRRLAAIRRLPASSASAAATAARRCCRCSIATRRGAPCKPFIGYSDLTSILTFLTLGCGLVAFHGPMLDGRLSRGADGYDARLVRACAVPPRADGRAGAAGRSSRFGPGRRPACCSAAR